MLIFTTFQQQKKKVTRCLSFLGRFFFWSNFTIDLAEEANMFRLRKEKCFDGIKIRNIGKIFILL
jgi:hypothetical protein